MSRVRSISYLSLALWAMLISMSPTVSAAESRQIQVIANPSVPLEQLSPSQARWIFSMRQTTWPDGQEITVYVLENQHSTHQLFAKKILSMFPYQLERVWNQLAYSGLGDKPITVADETQMLEKISQHPGAIGYVRFNAGNDDTQVIKIIKE